MLQKDVKVFLGKYRFKFSNAVRQGKRFFPCLRGSTGFFCEFLEGCGGGMQVFHSGLWENSCHEESVPLLAFNFIYPKGDLVLLQVFCILYEGNQSRALQEIPQLNYTMEYVTTYLQEIPQRIR